MKKLLIFTLLILQLFARENPFFPSSEKKETTSNIEPKESVFTTELLRIPIEAVKIRTISIEYLRSDGGVSVATYDIDKLFNSNRYMVVSQEGGISFGDATPAKPEIAKEQNESSKNITKNQLQKNQASKKQPLKRTKDIKFEFGKDFVNLSNTDEKIRDFTINEEGFKIVLDFYKSKDVVEKSYKVSKPPFKWAAVGDHPKFYRVAVELDSPKKYRIEKRENGYIIKILEEQ